MSRLNQAAALVTPLWKASGGRPLAVRYWLTRPSRACSSASTAWSLVVTVQVDVVCAGTPGARPMATASSRAGARTTMAVRFERLGLDQLRVGRPPEQLDVEDLLHGTLELDVAEGGAGVGVDRPDPAQPLREAVAQGKVGEHVLPHLRQAHERDPAGEGQSPGEAG